MQQLELQMTHFPYQPYMAFMRVKRRALAKVTEARTWMQLELKLVLRKLAKQGDFAFTVTMPNGRELRIPTLQALVKPAFRALERFFALHNA